jgi:hypothetical protein
MRLSKKHFTFKKPFGTAPYLADNPISRQFLSLLGQASPHLTRKFKLKQPVNIGSRMIIHNCGNKNEAVSKIDNFFFETAALKVIQF